MAKKQGSKQRSKQSQKAEEPPKRVSLPYGGVPEKRANPKKGLHAWMKEQQQQREQIEAYRSSHVYNW